MRILHISDSHGYFPVLLGQFDIVVHSGDFFKNSPEWVDRIKEIEFQYRWLDEQLPLMKQWLQNHPFLFVLGNHDFINADIMERKLNDFGIEAYNLADKITHFNGVNFYGFPWIPYINGMWNFECTVSQMTPHLEKMAYAMNQTYVDVLVSHPPLYNVLDLGKSNQHFGSTALINALDYKVSQDMLPQVMLHGHIHDSFGVTIRNGMLISNAALTQNIIEI